jgi:circadian clock protein KaiC
MAMDNARENAGSPGSTDPTQHEQRKIKQPTRLPTGVEGLDSLLYGGFLRGNIYIVSGQPGTGKTILSNQIAFGHVASGGRCVYVSLLSENPAHLFSHLSSLSFFNEEPIGNELYYVSGYGTLQEGGLKGLASMLQRLILDHSATLLIIDGALNVEQSGASELDFKAFVHQLQVFAETTGCAVLLLLSTGGGAAGAEGEAATLQVGSQTTVDGIIQLGYRRIEMRLVREIEVRKFRGSAHIEGGNSMQITGDGVQVYPRIEALLATSIARTQGPTIGGTRMAFGMPRLDQMLSGGLPEGSSTLLLGSAGSGKTLLGVQFLLEGARQGEPGLYFGMNEPLSVVMDAASKVNLDLAGAVSRGEIEAVWHLPVESIVDQIAAQLLEAVRRRDVKRLFLDSLESLHKSIVFPDRTSRFFTALLNELRYRGVCTVSALELPDLFSPSVTVPIGGISAAAENTIFMRSVELHSELHRLISILKLQRSGYDPTIREFHIRDEGIEIGDPFTGSEAVLTGLARPLPLSREDS